MAGTTFGWLTVNPSSGAGGTTTVRISGGAYEGRGIREQTIWFNPTNTTEVESVQFSIRQNAYGIALSDLRNGSGPIELGDDKVATGTVIQTGGTISYSFKTNAKYLYICAWNTRGTGGTFTLTNIKVNNVTQRSPTAGSLVVFNNTTEVEDDPGLTGLYDVSLDLVIDANTGTSNRNIRFYIAGADDDTDMAAFSRAHMEFDNPTDKEFLAAINITQGYNKPTVTITGSGVVLGDDGVYRTNAIPKSGGSQSFKVEASDNLNWAINERKITPSLEVN